MVLECDWKLFRKKLPEWQERHMQALLNDYAAIIAADDEDVATRFWELERRIKRDVRHVGVCADMRRSMMDQNLLCLLREKAIAPKDLEGFSDELRDYIAKISNV